MTNDQLLTIDDLAEMLKVPKQTLYAWRHQSEGPIGHRIGRHVRYRLTDVDEWLDSQRDDNSGRRT